MNIRSVFRVSSCHWKLSSFNIAKICYVAILIVYPLALSLPNSRRHFSYAKVQHFGTTRRHFLSTLLAFTQIILHHIFTVHPKPHFLAFIIWIKFHLDISLHI
jgi:hypothetical protein